MKLPEVRGHVLYWLKQVMFLVSVLIPVGLSLLYRNCLHEIHMLMKRWTWAMRRQIYLMQWIFQTGSIREGVRKRRLRSTIQSHLTNAN
jgi:hypothetical protein